MKKLAFTFSILVSLVSFSQSNSKQQILGIDQDKFFFDDSVFLSQHKIDEQKLKISILKEINAQRKLNHLQPLTLHNAAENKKAANWCDTMNKRRMLSHDNEYMMNTNTNRVQSEICVAYYIISINFKQTTDIYDVIAKLTVDTWMKSTQHRVLMLSPTISIAAIGSAFGKPSAAKYGINASSTARFY
jgi:uncharacterized protein YkwD